MLDYCLCESTSKLIIQHVNLLMKNLSINAVVLMSVIKALSHLKSKTNKYNLFIDQASH